VADREHGGVPRLDVAGEIERAARCLCTLAAHSGGGLDYGLFGYQGLVGQKLRRQPL
jgi:hypothetical protein